MSITNISIKFPLSAFPCKARHMDAIYLFELIVGGLQCVCLCHHIGQSLLQMRYLAIVFIALQLLFDLIIASNGSINHVLCDSFLVLQFFQTRRQQFNLFRCLRTKCLLWRVIDMCFNYQTTFKTNGCIEYSRLNSKIC